MRTRRLSRLSGAPLGVRALLGATTVLGALALSSTPGCAGARDTIVTARGAAPMRLERVVLYENGLAHFERRGLAPDGELDLLVPAAQVDDVIRSLTVVGAEGAVITGVRMLPASEGSDVTLRVGLRADASREVRVSYVTEAAGWRPSYRIVVAADRRVHLQGLAVVDNPTSEAWQDVALTLSTEVPLSFRFDLRHARGAYRPHFDANGRLVHDESLEVAAAPSALGAMPAAQGVSQLNIAYGLAQRDMPEQSTRAGMRVRAGADREEGTSDGSGNEAGAPGALLAFEEHTGEHGGVFRSVPGFDLGRGESGLVPFVDAVTEGEIALVFKPSPGGALSAVHPYRSVLFRNPSDASLLTGPVSIYADERFVGDGVTGTIPEQAHAFVPFALERSVTVERVARASEDEVHGTRLAGGVLTLSLRSVRHEGFVMTATRPIEETAYAFVAAVPGFSPRTLPEGAIVTPQGTFVPVTFAADGRGEVALDLVQQTTSTVNIASEPDARYVPALLTLLGDRPEAARLREIADRLLSVRSDVARVEEDLRVERMALEERREAMDALRAVSSAGAVRARLSTSIAEGVAHVDRLTTQATTLHAEDIALRQEWYGLLRATRG